MPRQKPTENDRASLGGSAPCRQYDTKGSQICQHTSQHQLESVTGIPNLKFSLCCVCSIKLCLLTMKLARHTLVLNQEATRLEVAFS